MTSNYTGNASNVAGQTSAVIASAVDTDPFNSALMNSPDQELADWIARLLADKAEKGTANSFTGNQTVTGDVLASGDFKHTAAKARVHTVLAVEFQVITAGGTGDLVADLDHGPDRVGDASGLTYEACAHLPAGAVIKSLEVCAGNYYGSERVFTMRCSTMEKDATVDGVGFTAASSDEWAQAIAANSAGRYTWYSHTIADFAVPAGGWVRVRCVMPSTSDVQRLKAVRINYELTTLRSAV